MGLLGKILSIPVRVANIPMRAVEIAFDCIDGEETKKEDRLLSAPLDAVAEAIEEV